MKTRYTYIDIAKAIGMLCVMWGHLMLGGRTNSFVYAFHIPLFFFLSGMMFRQKYSFRQFFVHRMRTLLLPYAIFSVVTWAYWLVRNLVLHLPMKSAFEPLLQTILAQGSGGYLVHNVALWFVTCLFAVEMLYFFLAKLPDWACAAACIACGILGNWMLQPHEWFDFKQLPWSLDAAMTAITFYGAGNLLIKHCSHERLVDFVNRKKWLFLVISLILCGIVLVFSPQNGHITLAQGSLGENTLTFYALAACGIGFVLIFSILLSNFRLSTLTWFGKNSFYAMAIHVPVMVDMVWLWAKIQKIDINALRYSYFATVPIFTAMLLLTALWMAGLNAIKRKK